MYGFLWRGELGAESVAEWRRFTPEAQTTERRSGALLQRSERGSAAAPARARLFFAKGRGSLLRRSAAAPAWTRLSSAEKRGGSDAGAALFCGEAWRLRRGHGSLLRRSAAAPARARLSSAEKRGGSDAGTALFCGEAQRLRCRRGSFLRRSVAAPARARLSSAEKRGGSGADAALFLRSVGCEERRGGSLSVRHSSAGGYSVTVSPAGRETRWLFQTASPPSRLARTVSLPSFREISTCPSGRGSVPSKESAADASGATTKVA